jgi:hypothetical protein
LADTSGEHGALALVDTVLLVSNAQAAETFPVSGGGEFAASESTQERTR